MAKRLITSPDQVDPVRLTAILTQAGVLTAGSVSDVPFTTKEGKWSSNARLTVEYSADSAGERPRNLFLKTVERFGPSEVFYYTRDYVDVDAAPLVRCFDAVFEDHPPRYHLLLQDVSQTHQLMLFQTPTTAYADALADGFAAMHARWWGPDRCRQIGERIPDAAAIERFVDGARPGMPHVFAAYGDEIGDDNVERIEAVFEAHPQAMINRTADATGFCLIHGDANPTNVFVPREGPGAPIYIIDRQPFDASLTVWLGVSDLTYAIVHRWEPEIRRRMEVPLLRRYHDQLQLFGVDDYTWEQLVADYALCATMSVYVAVEWCANGPDEKMKWLWMPMLMKSLTAVEDLSGYQRFS